MGEDKITYSDVEQYERFFSFTPPFLLERFAKKNTNLVSKFESQVRNYMAKLTDSQKNKLDIVLNSDIGDLQCIMDEAYEKTGKKQYKILSKREYRDFIENNLNEIRNMIE